MNERYDAFIGRWIIFHKGHLEIIQQVYNKNKKPILLLIMNTDEEPRAVIRAHLIKKVLVEKEIPHSVVIIPPISSINWGRNVGYETNYIQVDEEIQKISATKIRQKRAKGDNTWKDDIA